MNNRLLGGLSYVQDSIEKALRTAAERAARGRSFRRHLPARFDSAPILVSPDSQLKYLKPGESAFDAQLLDLAETFVQADSSVWDIGANIGVFSIAAAALAKRGRVLAVEADIWLAELVQRSARLQPATSAAISVLPVAISDSTGIASFVVAKRGRASSSLEAVAARSNVGGARYRSYVPTVTLDSLLPTFRPPSFMKIDVEGAEEAVLKGATRVLRESRPKIYVEVGIETTEAVTAILKSNGYELFDCSMSARHPVPIGKCAFNTLALPA